MLVNIYQAKTNLSKLIQLVLTRDEEIIIGKMGRPVAKLVPYKQPKKLNFGVLKGKITVKKDFDKPSQAIEKLFYE